MGRGRGGSVKATKMTLPLSRTMGELRRKEKSEGKGAEARRALVHLRKEAPRLECSGCRVIHGGEEMGPDV